MKLLSLINGYDHTLFYWCLQRKHRELMVLLSRWFSRSADGHLYILAMLMAATLEYWDLLTVLLVGFAAERIIYFVLKNCLKRRRPQQAIPSFISVIQPSDQFSFPSGHTSAAFFMCGVATAFFPIIAPLLLFWAVCVGASRVIIGVHFPSDIFAGAVLGYSVALITLVYR